MGNPVVHFEIAGPDGLVLQQFYRDLFGWKIDSLVKPVLRKFQRFSTSERYRMLG